MIESNKRTVRLTVAAVLAGDTPLGSDIIMDPSDMDGLGAPAEAAGILADAAKGGEDGRTAAHKALHRLADAGPELEINVLADKRDQKIRALDGVLGVAIGLIGLTVLIAVVGVGTTTALSVVERTRETGLLRAVGLSRGALRAMLTCSPPWPACCPRVAPRP
jgi:putative ABC transport system permease protein